VRVPCATIINTWVSRIDSVSMGLTSPGNTDNASVCAML